MKFYSSYVWMVIIFLFGLNILGLGFDYPTEWQLTWFILSFMGYSITDILERLKSK